MIPLVPQFIVPQDDHDKQDCENAAAKRWLAQQGQRLSALNVTALEDDLYCRQPLCQQLLDQQFNFILVCRPESHTTLYEHLEGIDLPTLTVKHNFGHGKQHLSSLLATLNILSLLFHTLLELLDLKYKLLRSHLPTRKTFFDDLRALTRYMYFDSWDHLLTFMLQGLELDIPPNTS